MPDRIVTEADTGHELVTSELVDAQWFEQALTNVPVISQSTHTVAAILDGMVNLSPRPVVAGKKGNRIKKYNAYLERRKRDDETRIHIRTRSTANRSASTRLHTASGVKYKPPEVNGRTPEGGADESKDQERGDAA